MEVVLDLTKKIAFYSAKIYIYIYIAFGDSLWGRAKLKKKKKNK